MFQQKTKSKQKSTSKSPRGSVVEQSSTKKQPKKLKAKNQSSISSEGLLLDEILGMEDKEVADLYFNRFL